MSALVQKRISITAAKITKEVEEAKAADDDDDEYCVICYTNKVVPDHKSLPNNSTTIEFSCKHRFCQDCTLEQLKTLIEKAAIDQLVCFDYQCQQKIPSDQIEAILRKQGKFVLLGKYERFKKDKDVEKDKLSRFCPYAGCGAILRAKDA